MPAIVRASIDVAYTQLKGSSIETVAASILRDNPREKERLVNVMLTGVPEFSGVQWRLSLMVLLPVYLCNLFPTPFDVVLPAQELSESVSWYSSMLGFKQHPDGQVVGMDSARVTILASQWQYLCIVKSTTIRVKAQPKISRSEHVAPFALIVGASAFDHLVFSGVYSLVGVEQASVSDRSELILSMVCQDPGGNWFRLVREPDTNQLRECAAFSVWLTQLGYLRTIVLSCISTASEACFIKRVFRREPLFYDNLNGGVPIESNQQLVISDKKNMSRIWHNLIAASQSVAMETDGYLDGDYLDFAWVGREKSDGKRVIRLVPTEPVNKEDYVLLLIREALLSTTIEACVSRLSG
jgi:hypothetical protein